MPSWVIDCSLAAALGLPDEYSAKADSLIISLDADSVLWIPSLWWYEITNVLVMAKRRERISEADANAIMLLYTSLPLQVDNMVMDRVADSTRQLAHQHHLTAYDAAYLELAQRRHLGMATLDDKLEKAAHACGLTVFNG